MPFDPCVLPLRKRPRCLNRCFETILKHKDLARAVEMYKDAESASVELYSIMRKVGAALRLCQPSNRAHVDYIVQAFNAVTKGE